MIEFSIINKNRIIIFLVRAILSVLISYKCILYIENHQYYFKDQFFIILYPCLICSILIFFGVFLNFLSIALLIILTTYELFIETYSLGSAISNVLLVFLILSTKYKECKNSDSSDSTQVEYSIIVIFLIIAVINFSAGILHLTDSYWKEGTSLSKILTNSFYTYNYNIFEKVKSTNQHLYKSITCLLAWTQIALQITMLPLSFTKYGFLFVRSWGIFFSLFSIIFFQISLLPYFYLVFWFLTLYLPYNYKLKYNFFNKSLRIKLHLIIYAIILLFSLSSLSLYLKFHIRYKYTSSNNLINKLLEDNKTEKYILELSKYLGLVTPNVFNYQDILSNTKWVVIYNICDSQKNLIPFINTDGSRLSYHSNDIIYYKNSIPIRRSLLANDMNQTLSHLIQVSAYDNRKSTNNRSNLYEFVFFEQFFTNLSRKDTDFRQTPVLSKIIDITPYL